MISVCVCQPLLTKDIGKMILISAEYFFLRRRARDTVQTGISKSILAENRPSMKLNQLKLTFKLPSSYSMIYLSYTFLKYARTHTAE